MVFCMETDGSGRRGAFFSACMGRIYVCVDFTNTDSAKTIPAAISEFGTGFGVDYGLMMTGDALCGSVGIHKADRNTGFLEFVKQEMTEGSYTCHIELDGDGLRLFAANYGGQILSVFELENGGISLRKKKDYISEDCSVHPNGRFAYATCELASQAVVLKYDEPGHDFEIIQYHTTLLYNLENLASALCIDPEGKYLYVGNRGEDTIAVFEVEPDTGGLIHKYHVDAGGRWPRELKMDTWGNYLFVANQMSDSVSVFDIDSAGRPTLCAAYTGSSQLACVALVREGEN